jgi:hypothetical protein
LSLLLFFQVPKKRIFWKTENGIRVKTIVKTMVKHDSIYADCWATLMPMRCGKGVLQIDSIQSCTGVFKGLHYYQDKDTAK